METTTEILKKQEVHQINIGGIVYEMVKFAQAEKAMLEYASVSNKKFVQPDVIKSVCEMCEKEKELQSDNLCKECYDSLPS